MAITKTQRELLKGLFASGRTISFNPSMQSAWITRPEGYTLRIPINTFNAMTLKGLLEKRSESSGTQYWAITDAGREILARSAAKP